MRTGTLVSAYAAQFSRQPWPALFAVAACGLVGTLLIECPSWLSASCGGSQHHVMSGIPVDSLDHVINTKSFVMMAVAWAAMLVAMMPLLIAAPILHVCNSVRPAQRTRSIVGFVMGYGMVWMLVGPLFVALSIVCINLLGNIAAPLVLSAFALMWSASPWHQTALNRAHRVPGLATFGFRADLSAIRYGVVHGAWCFSACCAWMLVPMTTGNYHVITMITVTIILVAERIVPLSRMRWRMPVALRLLGVANV